MVVTRNVEAYESIFKMIFERYEIPYFIDSKAELSLQPLVCLVLSLLDICNKGFQTQDIVFAGRGNLIVLCTTRIIQNI